MKYYHNCLTAICITVGLLVNKSSPQELFYLSLTSVAASAVADSTAPARAQDNPALTALPAFPARPQMRTETYPDCREDYRAEQSPHAQIRAINRCTQLIDDFYRKAMLPYREAMTAYQQQLSMLFMDKVRKNSEISFKDRQNYYQRMMREHQASTPEGDHQAAYRALEAQYKNDRSYLADRYCFNTGCNGYEVPSAIASPPTKRQSIRIGLGSEAILPVSTATKSGATCSKRSTGNVIGGVIGGLAGGAIGLDGLGTAMSGLIGATLAGEIACQLDEQEKGIAADAAIAVTKKEKVGATAAWVSPTREGVSGSSTITDLNTQPNGTRCLSIADIAIIDGEETRIIKRMCRSKAGEPYRIVTDPAVAFPERED